VIITVIFDSDDGAVIENWEVEITSEMKEYRKTFQVPETGKDYTYTCEALIPECYPMARVSFGSGHEPVDWFLYGASLVEAAEVQGQEASNVKPSAGHNRTNAAWSLKRVGHTLQLSGPSDVNATVLLYDIRGKLVSTASRPAGAGRALTISTQRLSAGTYFAVVRNQTGGELLRTRVTLMR
jgi:hypothetical protein